MLQFLLKPLLGVAGDAVKGFIQTKKAKAKQKITEINAITTLREKQIAGEVSWEDELILIVLLAPAVLVFVPGMTEHVERGFIALQKLPDYYKHLLYIACSASFGIKGAGSAIKFFNKKK
jgi:hypothetical protein